MFGPSNGIFLKEASKMSWQISVVKIEKETELKPTKPNFVRQKQKKRRYLEEFKARKAVQISIEIVAATKSSLIPDQASIKPLAKPVKLSKQAIKVGEATSCLTDYENL
ncbi:uncharacterized protein EV154DRAFT_479531 [Mucor mucedo]|uniref:uncharacterized protein n=1 Tax=Mucor mucedo TaxID=29922 RepID=UPI00221F8934|nr:uncharacterized protein EV154DRAFT_479531 [Mucor mucedo]KAI7893307.1 hypothetical protein EV154DRAFT_479531 [Mucor mucedo]